MYIVKNYLHSFLRNYIKFSQDNIYINVIKYCLISKKIITPIYHINLYIYIAIFYTAYIVWSCEIFTGNYLESWALSHATCTLPSHNPTSSTPPLHLPGFDLSRAQHALHIQMARFVCFNMHMTKYLSALWSSVVSLHLRCTNRNQKRKKKTQQTHATITIKNNIDDI